ncbi:MAG: hypothetical protein ACPGQL_01350 [Thermoplasmatota archaeon]
MAQSAKGLANQLDMVGAVVALVVGILLIVGVLDLELVIGIILIVVAILALARNA